MTVAAAPLRAFVAEIFAAAGCDAEEAARIARYLVAADLVGHPSHGVIRVPRYLDAMARGSVHPGREIEIVREAPGFAVVDGKSGFGQTVGEQAVDLGIARARDNGVAAVGLRNSAHLGRIGDWPERAAAAGMASVHFVNASGISPAVAPFGGIDKRMSTNPFAAGVPNGDEPIILDFATSVVAEGKVLVAVNGGKPLPDGALIDGDGALSSNPEALYGPITDKTKVNTRNGRGAIRTMGDHKGSGLSMMCELLAGALGGNGCASDAGPSVLANGMFSVYVDASALDTGGFAREVSDFVAWARTARPIDPSAPVLAPGDPERARRRDREANGIPLEEDTCRSLLAVAERYRLRAPAEIAARSGGSMSVGG